MKQLEEFINFIYHNYKQEVKHRNIGPFLFSLQQLAACNLLIVRYLLYLSCKLLKIGCSVRV